MKGRFAFSNPLATNTFFVQNLAFEFIGWDIFLLLARSLEDIIENAQKDSSELSDVELQEWLGAGVFEEANRILNTIMKEIVPTGSLGT